MILEICCGSYFDAITAYQHGITRIELNSALNLGGLTPYVEDVKRLKKETNLNIICMVRYRGGGFCYDDKEFQYMYQQATLLLEAGADGLAFGFLNSDHTIHKEFTLKMVKLVHSYDKVAVFHRAIDVTKNMEEAVQTLIDLGVDRLLTSGQQPTAMQGIQEIALLQDKYGKKIEILPGSGINKNNVKLMIETAHVNQIHASCKNYKMDSTSQLNDVSFKYHPQGYEYVDGNIIDELKESLIP